MHQSLGHAPRVFGLDALRATAILLVIVAHLHALWLHDAVPVLGRVPFGSLGVDLFFVLSGFLIGGLLLDEGARLSDPGTVPRFWARRWYRTLPTYALLLAINVAVATALGFAVPNIWPYVVFVQSLAWAHPSFMRESWSLAVEEWFYLLVPVAWWWAARRLDAAVALIRVAIAFLLIPAALRFGAVLFYDVSWDGVQAVVFRLDAIMYGVIAVALARRAPARWIGASRPAAWFGAVALLALTVGYALSDYHTSVFLRSWFFSAVSLAVACLLPALAQWQPGDTTTPRAVRALARWSYALYLTHMPVGFLLGARPGQPVGIGGAKLAWHCLLWAVTSVTLAAAIHRWWERPWLAIRDRRSPVARSGDNAR